ncbi:MAG: hypothetical protein HYS17_05790 [Micavibrio aeruginosavorus]|uniref:YMGG-like Gly-zipper domain-containing protein n=1 Tax=Micavibrio aeruginosavorus TaxID=349221 RepID=A0A7T5R4B7_9BACT|nr:MAG: hypothetical protein HYS17_05790 [Micavibrio aeruginosavorus]
MRITLLLIFISLGLTACSGGMSRTDHAVIGGVAGGAAGAIATKDVTGAGVGAVIGAGIGAITY